MPEKFERKFFFWKDEDIKKFPELPKPVETWEMNPGESRKIRVKRFNLYRHLITPKFFPAGVKKLTLCLRIWVYSAYKEVGPPYWDIHQSHLISTLIPLFRSLDYPKYEFEITWVGKGPSARPEVKYKKLPL